MGSTRARTSSPGFAPTASARRRERVLRLGAYLAWHTGLLVVLCGIALEEPWIVAVGTAVVCAGLLAYDLRPGPANRFSPLTLFALGSAMTAVANATGLLAADTSARSVYFRYAAEEHLGLAMQLAFAGAVLPVLGFWLGGHPGLSPLRRALPAVRGDMSRATLTWLGGFLAVAVVGLKAFSLLPPLGTVSDAVRLFPVLVAFTLARYGMREGSRSALGMAFTVAVLEALRALLFSYLRSEVLLPVFAFSIGVLLGAQSLRPLRSLVFVPIYAGVIGFVAFFGSFGQARATMGTGLGRISALASTYVAARTAPADNETLLGRFTSFNQLSQIGRVVDEDGFLEGSTMSYLSYAFIPRFLWPGKPEIAKGAWYAHRIGQAVEREDGRYSNSVNMTVSGELYLNFGWAGVLAGNLALGALLAFLWRTVDFWRNSRNVLGSAFGFYLLFIGAASLGADLQVVVTLVAMYLVFAAAGMALTATRRPRGAGRPATLRADGARVVAGSPAA